MINFGSLFAGIGGFDLGFERAGMVPAWQVEINHQCQEVLARHWPNTKRYGDIRDVIELAPVKLVCGGDPCPKHSRARSNGASRSPDLAGYFLALVGRLRPRWVVRENVLAPTVEHFDTALAALGYGTAVIRLDAAEVTGQSRPRDFIVGLHQASRQRVREIFSECQDGSGPFATRLETQPVAPALTAHRTRYDSRDCYIFEYGRLRILDGEERAALAGFPGDWLAGFSEAAQARMYGNAVVPALAEWMGRWIVTADEKIAR